jgi:hypothetical protein
MRFLGLLIVSGALASLPAPAEACTPAGTFGPVTMFPRNGDLDMPVNAVIRLDIPATWEAAGVDLLVVRPVGGAQIELSLSELSDGWRKTVSGRPVEALAPETTYEVLTPLTYCEFVTGCIAAELQLVGSFTTGATADTDPPRLFEGLDPITETSFEDCDSGACCGPFSGYHLHFGWGAALDAGPITFNVYADDVLVLTNVQSTFTFAFYSCSGDSGGLRPILQLVPGVEYRVTAVDVAGNEDTNTVVRTADFDCSTGACGCRAVRRPETSGGGGLLLAGGALVALAIRRRR